MPRARRCAGWEHRAAGRSDRSGLEVGIGIATGYATMGRIGFEGRYDYGGVGNAIILASRLSGEAVAGQILMAARRTPRSTRRWPSRSASVS